MLRLLLFLLLTSASVISHANNAPVRLSWLTTHDGLGSNHVRAIIQDKTGYIWMGTTYGLYRYDGYTVTIVKANSEEEQSLYEDNRIQDMTIWDGRFLVIRLRGRQYSVYDTQAGRFVDYAGAQLNKMTFRDFVVTKDKGLWLTNDESSSMNVTYRIDGNSVSFSSKLVNHIPNDVKKAKENRHKAKSAELARLRSWAMGNIAERLSGITEKDILSVFQDRDKNIFLSIADRGVVIASNLMPIAHYIYNGNDSNDVLGNKIKILYEDAVGDIRMFSQSSALSCHLTDSEHHEWFGTRNNSIVVDGKEYTLPNPLGSAKDDTKVSGICQDKKGRIWISMFNGLLLCATLHDGGVDFTVANDKLVQPRMIMCDHHGVLWICSSEGVFIYDTETAKQRQIAIGHDNLKVDETHCVMEDSRHRIWIGTIGFGLAMIDNTVKGQPHVKHIYTQIQGLPDDRIQSVIEDRQHNVWVGTDYGIAVISDKQCYRLYPGDSDLGMTFMENSVSMLHDGKLAFGTRAGVAIIDPHSVLSNINKQTVTSHPLELSDLLVNGNSLPRETWGNALSYEQNTLRFYVTNLDYSVGALSTGNGGEKVYFQFFLEGSDKDWQPLQQENWHQYSNLPPGTYTLHVRAISQYGQVQDNQLTLSIRINSPWWATWWAITLYIIIVLGVTATIVAIYYRHWRNRQELLAKIRVEETLTRYKMLFFTNVSHEFRTPLTIIKGAMDVITAHERVPKDMLQPLSSMKKSTDRLMRLINQLMDFSRIHDGKLTVRVQETEVVSTIRDITDTFKTIAERKHINLAFKTTEKRLSLPVDRSILDKVIYNLVSNAMKYTPSGGDVEVKVSTSEGNLLLSVSDTGIGISEEKQQMLFTRFDQSAFISDSIGIGLHLIKDYISSHHGTITYTGNQPSGSIFTVSLPMDASAYGADEWFRESELSGTAETSSTQRETASADYHSTQIPPLNDKSVLIVEDDADVQEFISQTLKSHFRIITASNGKEALEMLRRKDNPVSPDLIITDIMMPIMGGMKFVEQLSTAKHKNTIPVIMLTALGDEEHQVKAFNLGVDAFMRKPFTPQILLSRALQLIQQRMDIATNAAQESSAAPAKKEPKLIIDSQDKRFRSQFNHWLNEHLSDPQLSVDMFAESMGIGRTTFYHRVKEITGKSPNEYIRQKRMERAMELLADDKLTIQQVATKVGIDDSLYFAKIFKAFCGMPPSVYRKTGGKKSEE